MTIISTSRFQVAPPAHQTPFQFVPMHHSSVNADQFVLRFGHRTDDADITHDVEIMAAKRLIIRPPKQFAPMDIIRAVETLIRTGELKIWAPVGFPGVNGVWSQLTSGKSTENRRVNLLKYAGDPRISLQIIAGINDPRTLLLIIPTPEQTDVIQALDDLAAQTGLTPEPGPKKLTKVYLIDQAKFRMSPRPNSANPDFVIPAIKVLTMLPHDSHPYKISWTIEGLENNGTKATPSCPWIEDMPELYAYPSESGFKITYKFRDQQTDINTSQTYNSKSWQGQLIQLARYIKLINLPRLTQ